jgi:hypothetical protein
MRGRAASLGLVFIATSVLVPAAVAQGRSAPRGAVVVRPVQVREVRVNQPAPTRPLDQRPSLVHDRPVNPDFISRPLTASQPIVTPRSPIRSGSWPRGVNGRRGRIGSHSFKPRFNTGYGPVVGYPILYPYAYPYDPFSPAYAAPYNPPPAPNTYSNVETLSTPGNVTAATSLPAAIACEASAPCGGVSFDISPGSAQVYVDGVFAGLVEDFDDTSAPLLLAPGDHYIEIRLAGYRTASFDVTITPGEVTPYQGTLERLRLRTP